MKEPHTRRRKRGGNILYLLVDRQRGEECQENVGDDLIRDNMITTTFRNQ